MINNVKDIKGAPLSAQYKQDSTGIVRPLKDWVRIATYATLAERGCDMDWSEFYNGLKARYTFVCYHIGDSDLDNSSLPENYIIPVELGRDYAHAPLGQHDRYEAEKASALYMDSNFNAIEGRLHESKHSDTPANDVIRSLLPRIKNEQNKAVFVKYMQSDPAFQNMTPPPALKKDYSEERKAETEFWQKEKEKLAQKDSAFAQKLALKETEKDLHDLEEKKDFADIKTINNFKDFLQGNTIDFNPSNIVLDSYNAMIDSINSGHQLNQIEGQTLTMLMLHCDKEQVLAFDNTLISNPIFALVLDQYKIALESHEVEKARAVACVLAYKEGKARGLVSDISEITDITSTYKTLYADIGIYTNMLARKRAREILESINVKDMLAKSNNMQQTIKDIADLVNKAQSYSTLSDECANQALQVMQRIADKARRAREGYSAKINCRVIDDTIGGLYEGNLITIGARTSVGKSTLCTQIANAIIKNTRENVAYFSTEMDAEQLLAKIASCRGKVDYRCYSDYQFVSKNAIDCLGAVVEDMREGRIKIEETAKYINDILQRVDFLAVHGYKKIIIDHIGNLISENPQENRTQALDRLTIELKQIARKHNITIIVASQLKREAQDTAPSLASLRESGGIEQNSDSVILLNRYLQDLDGKTQFIVAKNRNGLCQTLEGRFFGKYQYFTLNSEGANV